MRKLLLMLTAMGLLLVAAKAEPTIIGERDGKDVVTVRAGEATQSKQGLPNFVGISGATAGAKHLSLLKVVIPPGGSAEAHVHKGYEFGDLSDAGTGRDPLWRRAEEKRGECRRRLSVHPA